MYLKGQLSPDPDFPQGLLGFSGSCPHSSFHSASAPLASASGVWGLLFEENGAFAVHTAYSLGTTYRGLLPAPCPQVPTQAPCSGVFSPSPLTPLPLSPLILPSQGLSRPSVLYSSAFLLGALKARDFKLSLHRDKFGENTAAGGRGRGRDGEDNGLRPGWNRLPAHCLEPGLAAH